LTTHAHADSTCPVILLAPGTTYVLKEFIRVLPGRRVAVVGESTKKARRFHLLLPY
jgi:hypothetical protein